MRPIWVGLVILAILSTGMHMTSLASGQARWTAAPPPPAAPAITKSPRQSSGEGEIVEGYGQTAATARDRALEEAEKRVRELLAKRLRLPSWEPPDELLTQETLAKYRVINEGDVSPGPQLIDERLLVARYKIRLTPEYVREAARTARMQQTSGRHLLAGRILAGLLGLLLVAVGYLRLEEMTRGYATQLLRAGAGALILLLVLGLYFIP